MQWRNVNYLLLIIFVAPFYILAQDAEPIGILFEKNEFSKIVKVYEKQPSTFTNKSDLEFIGKAYYSEKNYIECIDLLKPILLENINSDSFYDAYSNGYYISWSYKILGEVDSALHYSKIALQNAQRTGSKSNVGKALHNLARIYIDDGDFTTSILHYQKALEYKKGDTASYMQTKSSISNNYFQIGLLDSAVRIASETYKYFRNEDQSNYWKWISTYRLAYMEKDYKNELARSYYREILSFSNDEYRQVLAEVGLTESYLLDMNDSALFHFNIAWDKANEIDHFILLREVNFSKARIYLELTPNQALLKEALADLNKILDQQKDERSLPLLRILESRFFLNGEKEDSSLYFVNSAISNAKEFGLKDRLAEALTQKFNVLNHFGRYKEALEVKEEEIKVREELFNDRSEAVYQILRTQNEMDKQESTIANQQLEIDNNNLQILIMYISIALVISALVFIFWQYRTRSKYAQKLETMFLDSRHRYMNNLLLLKNWFNEGKTEKNDEIISFAQNRIDAISTVNRHLDRLSYNKDTIESKSFLEDISHNLLANREFTSEIENVPINMSVSGPLGMITNEIITNGLKYGDAPYAIRFHKNGGGYVLEIEDHGPGIADPEKQGTGSKVLRLLSRQLKGKLTYQNKADHSPDARGTLVSLNFKG